jgi:hypothetical protein
MRLGLYIFFSGGIAIIFASQKFLHEWGSPKFSYKNISIIMQVLFWKRFIMMPK